MTSPRTVFFGFWTLAVVASGCSSGQNKHDGAGTPTPTPTSTPAFIYITEVDPPIAVPGEVVVVWGYFPVGVTLDVDGEAVVPIDADEDRIRFAAPDLALGGHAITVSGMALSDSAGFSVVLPVVSYSALRAAAGTMVDVKYRAQGASISTLSLPGKLGLVGGTPTRMAILPGERLLYLALDTSLSAFAIDSRTGSLTELADTPYPSGGLGGSGLKIFPSKTHVAVANCDSGDISVLSIASGGGLTPVPGSPFPTGVPCPEYLFAYSTAASAADYIPSAVRLVAVGSSGHIATFVSDDAGALTPVDVVPGVGGATTGAIFSTRSSTNGTLITSDAVRDVVEEYDISLSTCSVSGGPSLLASVNDPGAMVTAGYDPGVLLVAENSGGRLYRLQSYSWGDFPLPVSQGPDFATGLANVGAMTHASKGSLWTFYSAVVAVDRSANLLQRFETDGLYIGPVAGAQPNPGPAIPESVILSR